MTIRYFRKFSPSWAPAFSRDRNCMDFPKIIIGRPPREGTCVFLKDS